MLKILTNTETLLCNMNRFVLLTILGYSSYSSQYNNNDHQLDELCKRLMIISARKMRIK